MQVFASLFANESEMGLLTRLTSSQKGNPVHLNSGMFQRLLKCVFSQRSAVTGIE
jgi:hypothetical protein